jgi:hypothetical protein
MLHACFTPFASCFVYSLWRFDAISGTNLLTRCHSASSLISAVLCFRKVTQEIFSELDKPKTETPIFPGWRTWTERETEVARGQPHHEGARPPLGRAQGWWDPPCGPLTPPLRLFKASRSPNPKTIGVFPRTVPQHRCRQRQILGDRSLYSGTLPGRGSAPGAVSIGLHRRLCRLHRPHRHLHHRCCLQWWGGSSSPPGPRALPVAMWFTSLSHDVIFMWSWALYLELVDAIIQILCYSCALLL